MAGYLATGLMALSFVASCVLLGASPSSPGDRAHVSDLYTWLPAGTLTVHFGFLVDPLSVTMILFVTGVGTLIHLYAIGYMHGDERFRGSSPTSTCSRRRCSSSCSPTTTS